MLYVVKAEHWPGQWRNTLDLITDTLNAQSDFLLCVGTPASQNSPEKNLIIKLRNDKG